MKNSINNLSNQLTSREKLSTQQMAAIKGGDGEDLRRDNFATITVSNKELTVTVKPPTTEAVVVKR